nr:hypothetical protein [Angustibacter aerolatus]
MQTRPATYDDVPALTALQGAYATRWFGAPEEDEAEPASAAWSSSATSTSAPVCCWTASGCSARPGGGRGLGLGGARPCAR